MNTRTVQRPAWFNDLIKNEQDVLMIKDKIIYLYQSLINTELLSLKNTAINENTSKDLFKKTFALIEEYQFKIQGYFSLFYWYLYLESDNSIKETIQKTLTELENFVLDHFTYNMDIYTLLKDIGAAYLKNPSIKINEKKLIERTLYDYEKLGIHLPADQQARIKELSLLISNLSREFELNIQNQDNHIIATKEMLTGLTPEQCSRLPKQGDNSFKIGVDYPTYNMVMSYCSNEKVRKELYTAFNTRAFPNNVPILEKIRLLTKEYADLVGYKNYAMLDLKLQMAKTVENVESFLEKTREATAAKATKEKELLTAFARTVLFKDQSYVIHPWDISYVYTAYEKAIFNIDAEEIAKYFPVKKTIEKMIELYSLFFGLDMRLISYDKDIGKNEWNMLILEIRKKNEIKGHLLFDLYPREGKYSHACFSTLVSSVFKENEEGLRELPLGLIIANFNKPTVLHDGLMKYEEARTLFHEMGHAMHHFLATTEFVSHSGTSTLHDFVEVPSQLFEQWFLEKPIIKQVSSHYLSGDTLTDPVIENIIKLEFYNMGLFIQRQINSSLLSLYLFTKNEEEIELIRQSLAHKTISLSYYDNVFNQSVYSFGHITPGVYGPKYYVYLWSLVYAIDFFQKINAKENGLYAAEMGKHLEETVLKKAGFEDPEELSKAFLKRDLSFDSFYAYLNK